MSAAPSNYQEWLACLEAMKTGTSAGAEAFEAARRGSFVGSEQTKSALQRQIVETVNAILDKSARRFVRALNESLSFRDLTQTESLFRRLKKDVGRSLFFVGLDFLPAAFRSELAEAVKARMSGFWEDTVGFLRRQTLEHSDPELEDLLFRVGRINLF